MSKQTDTKIESLIKFGLDEEEASIYLYLNKNGPSTALKISKDLNIGRTKVYRILDTLHEKNLTVQNLKDRGFQFEAAAPQNLNQVLIEKKKKVQELETLYPQIVDNIEQISVDKSTTGNVKYYKGIKGLEQITWNSLRADKELYIYEMVSDMSKFLSKKNAEEIRREQVKRRIHAKQLTNLKKFEAFTNVHNYVHKHWTARYIDPKVLKISYEVLIYNDVVAQYNMRGKDVFCVEIHDKRLAEMQKDLFKYVWSTAKEFTVANEKGEAHLQ